MPVVMIPRRLPALFVLWLLAFGGMQDLHGYATRFAHGTESMTVTEFSDFQSATSSFGVGTALVFNPSGGSILPTGVSGTLGGLPIGISLDTNGRVTQTNGPGSSQSITYGDDGAGGFTVSTHDSIMGTNGEFDLDFAGDATVLNRPGSLPLTLTTTDTASGHQTTINGGLTLTSNYDFSITGKNYGNGLLAESVNLNSDGTESSETVSGAGGSAPTTVTETPTQETISYADGTGVASF